MVAQQLMRVLFSPMLVPTCIVCLLLVANCMPKVWYGVPYIPTPGKGYRASCTGVRGYGWPKTATRELFVHYDAINNPPFQPRYSISHLARQPAIEVLKTERSLSSFLVNVVLVLVSVVLLAISVQAIVKRQFSLRSLLLIVTCVSIMTASLHWNDPLAVSPSLPMFEEVERL